MDAKKRLSLVSVASVKSVLVAKRKFEGKNDAKAIVGTVVEHLWPRVELVCDGDRKVFAMTEFADKTFQNGTKSLHEVVKKAILKIVFGTSKPTKAELKMHRAAIDIAAGRSLNEIKNQIRGAARRKDVRERHERMLAKQAETVLVAHVTTAFRNIPGAKSVTPAFVARAWKKLRDAEIVQEVMES